MSLSTQYQEAKPSHPLTEEILSNFDKEFVDSSDGTVEPVFIDPTGSVGPVRAFIVASLTRVREDERARVLDYLRASFVNYLP